MFKKNKVTKKPKGWWKTNSSDELKVAAGANYKVVTGFVTLMFSGLMLLGLSALLHSFGGQAKTVSGLVWAGGALCFTAFIGMITTIAIQIQQGKKHRISDTKAEIYRQQLSETQRKYEESKKDILGPVRKKKDDEIITKHD